MFWQYWKLACSPFDNVPDPKMYCDRNPSLEDAISEILFAIDEGNDCLAVMVGDIGLGKTLALRVIMDELDPQRYQIVFVTNPDLTFVQLLREIVGQLKGQPVETRFKDALQEEFNRHLFEAAGKRQRVVIMIDEANALSRSVLQNLRLLTNMQDDDRNLVSIVLAGQLELGKKLATRNMDNLFQRVGVYCQIKGLETAEMVRDYIEFRMQRSGATEPVFTPEAASRIHHYSGGVPRLVNKLCKLALKAGETNQLKLIEADLIEGIAAMFDKAIVASPQRLPEPVLADEPAEPVLAPEAVLVDEPAEPEAAPPLQDWVWARSPLSDWGKEPVAGGAPQDALPAAFPAPVGPAVQAEAPEVAAPEPEPWVWARSPLSDWGKEPVAGGAPQDALPAVFPEPVMPAVQAEAPEVAAPEPEPWVWARSPLSDWGREPVAGGAPQDALPAVFPEPVTIAAPQEEETKVIQQVVASLQAPPESQAPGESQAMEPRASEPEAEEPKAAPGAAARPSAPAQAGQRRLSLVHGGAGEPKAPPRAEEPQAAPVAAPETRAARTAEEPPAALSAEQLAEIISGLSAQIIEQVRAMDERQVIKLAGELAAKEMWQHEKAIRLSHGDPIDFWERSRAQIAAKLRLMGASASAFAAGRA